MTEQTVAMDADPAPASIARAAGPTRRLTVVEARNVTPHMRRVSFAFDGADTFAYEPGQALVFAVPLGGGDTGRRDYTIRSLDREAGRLDVDFVIHGDAPGSSWARDAEPGAVIEARGPRGKTVFNPEADWHLFVGDETCMPAILHILEQMPEGVRAFVFFEVAGPEDAQDCDTVASVTIEYVRRSEMPAEADTNLARRIEAFELPEGRGQAYVIGETGKVREIRRRLIERGMDKSEISAEGYWRPGRIGGHDHIKD